MCIRFGTLIISAETNAVSNRLSRLETAMSQVHSALEDGHGGGPNTNVLTNLVFTICLQKDLDQRGIAILFPFNQHVLSLDCYVKTDCTMDVPSIREAFYSAIPDCRTLQAESGMLITSNLAGRSSSEPFARVYAHAIYGKATPSIAPILTRVNQQLHCNLPLELDFAICLEDRMLRIDVQPLEK